MPPIMTSIPPPPTHCPTCHAPLVRTWGNGLYCPLLTCPSIVADSIQTILTHCRTTNPNLPTIPTGTIILALTDAGITNPLQAARAGLHFPPWQVHPTDAAAINDALHQWVSNVSLEEAAAFLAPILTQHPPTHPLRQRASTQVTAWLTA